MSLDFQAALPPFVLAEPPLAAAVHEGLARIEGEIRRLLFCSNQTLAEAIQDVMARPGKRLRPLVAVLAALAAKGELDRNVIRGAAAVEVLHLASLLHDDVIDQAGLRSGRTTCNALLGNQPAVLLGDFFFARALSGAARINLVSLRRFLAVAEDLVAGEFSQAVATGCLPRVDSYLSWIEAKTASLFALAASLGRDQCLQRYGHDLGLAYQLRDDLLDLTAAESDLGKPTMNDCGRGLFTYPVIAACNREPASFGLLTAARPADPAWRRDLAMLLCRTGAIGLAWEVCRDWAGRARQNLGDLPPSQAREALAALADWVGRPCRDEGSQGWSGR